ncbi:MAG: YkvA family protein [Phormidesmis sp.]
MKKHFATALYDLYRKALRHTKYRWVVILGTLLYLVSPLDISPDVFPVLGWLDDGLVVSLLVTEISQLLAEQTRKRSETPFATTEIDTETGDAYKTITVDAVSVS